jgi:hypothetical protein
MRDKALRSLADRSFRSWADSPGNGCGCCEGINPEEVQKETEDEEILDDEDPALAPEEGVAELADGAWVSDRHAPAAEGRAEVDFSAGAAFGSNGRYFLAGGWGGEEPCDDDATWADEPLFLGAGGDDVYSDAACVMDWRGLTGRGEEFCPDDDDAAAAASNKDMRPLRELGDEPCSDAMWVKDWRVPVK